MGNIYRFFPFINNLQLSILNLARQTSTTITITKPNFTTIVNRHVLASLQPVKRINRVRANRAVIRGFRDGSGGIRVFGSAFFNGNCADSGRSTWSCPSPTTTTTSSLACPDSLAFRGRIVDSCFGNEKISLLLSPP
ncbi:hypothetical protein GWI33_020286 [Rhynchophorus ferrugineus]|uniref:Uncharacterized protein n=1 Tax=Rhynchophorus ferrugineus TaxID=354439 RepID=A0A834HPR8_RHYFE|nr:hypothetical protein GWI33_020286 [Rhynchophorus ferrugineus]